jgi:hypothetical protein
MLPFAPIEGTVEEGNFGGNLEETLVHHKASGCSSRGKKGGAGINMR